MLPSNHPSAGRTRQKPIDMARTKRVFLNGTVVHSRSAPAAAPTTLTIRTLSPVIGHGTNGDESIGKSLTEFYSALAHHRQQVGPATGTLEQKVATCTEALEYMNWLPDQRCVLANRTGVVVFEPASDDLMAHRRYPRGSSVTQKKGRKQAPRDFTRTSLCQVYTCGDDERKSWADIMDEEDDEAERKAQRVQIPKVRTWANAPL